jgi:hypothetical protein
MVPPWEPHYWGMTLCDGLVWQVAQITPILYYSLKKPGESSRKITINYDKKKRLKLLTSTTAIIIMVVTIEANRVIQVTVKTMNNNNYKISAAYKKHFPPMKIPPTCITPHPSPWPVRSLR